MQLELHMTHIALLGMKDEKSQTPWWWWWRGIQKRGGRAVKLDSIEMTNRTTDTDMVTTETEIQINVE